jgi:hypothetical protein
MKDARTLAEIKRQGNGNRVSEDTGPLTVNFMWLMTFLAEVRCKTVRTSCKNLFAAGTSRASAVAFLRSQRFLLLYLLRSLGTECFRRIQEAAAPKGLIGK